MPGADGEPRVAVLDASVAIRWIVPEPGSREACALLEQPIDWVSPRLILTEAAAALRRKVAAGELLTEEALQSFDAFLGFLADGSVRIANEEEVVRAALILAVAFGHKLPDCVYLALAEHERVGLFTADHRLAALARERGVPVTLLAS